MSDEVVERARALIGCVFRPQGRLPQTGLDCVGVACVAYAIPPDQIPSDYRLRSGARDRLYAEIGKHFMPASELTAGDLMILAVGYDQFHLAVRTDRGFVHADARLRKIVETPGVPSWPILSVHRPHILKTAGK